MYFLLLKYRMHQSVSMVFYNILFFLCVCGGVFQVFVEHSDNTRLASTNHHNFVSQTTVPSLSLSLSLSLSTRVSIINRLFMYNSSMLHLCYLCLVQFKDWFLFLLVCILPACYKCSKGRVTIGY